MMVTLDTSVWGASGSLAGTSNCHQPLKVNPGERTPLVPIWHDQYGPGGKLTVSGLEAHEGGSQNRGGPRLVGWHVDHLKH